MIKDLQVERDNFGADPHGFKKNVCSYEMLPLEEQLEIAHQIGTTRAEILKNLVELSVGTSFL